MKDKKVVLLSYRLGYQSLLYWDPILSSINQEVGNLLVFTAFPKLVTSDGMVVTEPRLKGIRIHIRKTHKNGYLIYLPLPFFIIRIRKLMPDLIILNEFNFNSLYIILSRFLLKNTRLLLLVENDPFIGYLPNHSRFRKCFRKYIAKRVDAILTNNQLGYKYLLKGLNVHPSNITAAPYLVSIPPTPSERVNPFEYLNDRTVFLYVGSLIQRKGIIEFLDVISLLDDKIQEKCAFFLIGQGDLYDYIVDFKTIHKLDCLNVIGSKPYNELANYYYHADCFILPTLYDYRALVGFEAISFGCAIIESKYDGARYEIVTENVNGFIVDPRNSTEFKTAIEKLIDDRKLLTDFKKNSSRIALNYKMEVCVSNLVSVVSKILMQK